MFLASTLLYPVLLALLCLGAGLLVERVCSCALHAALLPVIGAAALIALSQLASYAYPLARATPYLMGATAIAGVVLARARLRSLASEIRQRPWLVLLPLAVYALALAPVLASGRSSLSSYMALTDSAVHMLGASFLLHEGQHYAHLDLRNSYGQYINDYYNTSYPSGADTLYGGSAQLIGLTLIWAFQPFNAFVLALASGPAWVLARRAGLGAGLASLAALTAVLAALVYAYELFGSIKEITSIAMILALGCLVVEHRRWLQGAGARAVLPFALVSAAGVSALGLAFGVWALASAVVLVIVIVRGGRAPRAAGSVGSLARLAGVAVAAGAVAALPTLVNVRRSFQVAQGIASTSNPGNLDHPLHAIQVLGVWLNGSYKLEPTGGALVATYVLVGVSIAACVIGAFHLLARLRAFALAGWIALVVLAWLVVAQSVTTWAAAKTLMLTSPVVVLLAWCGVAALGRLRRRALAVGLGGALAVALAGGALASDALQYHVSNLAPTARYEELASLDARFAGRGPTLFTPFDEYSLYELRDLDVGGPDFRYPPPAVAAAAGGHGLPVELDRLAPAALRPYRLIITRRDPSQSRPPSAYQLLWRGSYYEVWGRRARAASVHALLQGSPVEQCAAIGYLASLARSSAASLSAALAPQLIEIALLGAARPPSWGRERAGLVMSSAGSLSASFTLPHGGRWRIWVQGQIMPAVTLRLDGHLVGSISDQLDGNSLVPDTVPPIAVTLAAGSHRISVRRGASGLGPGEGGAAVLDAVFLTAAGAGESRALRVSSASGWRSLCGSSYQWVELIDG